VWTPAQLTEAIGTMNALVFGAAYGVTHAGNFEHGTSVLSRVTPRVSVGEEEQLAELRATLHAARERRVRPGTDDKVLAGWNGLAIAGLVRAWEATGHAPALALAERAARFLRDRMIAGDASTSASPSAALRGSGQPALAIARVFHGGVVKALDGTLEDYAFVADGFQRLAEATGDRAWWDLAARLVATARATFVGEDDGVVVCYLAPAGDALLPHRPESHQDGALPSGAAVLMRALVRLGHVAGDDDAMKLAERYLVQRLAGATSAGTAWANSALHGVLDLYLHGQVVVIPDGTGRDALLRALRTTYAPTAMLAGPWAAASVLEAKTASPAGEARAFVCTGPTCAAPVTEPAALAQLLAPRSAGGDTAS
ncbi:MAG: thioredoxin domain-containing protein, partial [Myxococcales bacterium]|nr:thioredoxin domain-containing protein [Myxococcales bacterium]